MVKKKVDSTQKECEESNERNIKGKSPSDYICIVCVRVCTVKIYQNCSGNMCACLNKNPKQMAAMV